MERKIKKLTDLCKIQYGYAFDSNKFSDDPNNIALIRIRDVKLGKSQTYYCGEYDKCYVVNPGDILVGMDGEFNIAKWNSKPALLNQRVCRIFVMDDVDEDYLKYYLSIELKKIEDRTAFVTVKHLSAKELNALQLYVHDFITQKEISQELKCVDKVIKEKKNQLELLDTLVKSRFVEMFGDISRVEYKYEIKKLGEVATVGSSHRVFTDEFVDKGVPFYRGTEIGELANGHEPTELYFISEEHYARLSNDETKPQIGDLLMPSICNKGQVWMVDTDKPFYYKDGRVLCVSPNRDIYDSKYLQYYMKIKTEVEYPKLGSGSTFAEFKIFLLKELDVLTPPRKVQEQFAIFVTQVDKSKFAVQRSLEKMEILKESLMQKYFG